MSIAQSMLPEFDNEMANTRKLLERVPLDKPAWKPHEKSMPLGYLAAHVATLPRFGHVAIETEEFDIAPAGKPTRTVPEFKTTAELLAAFDAEVKHTRDALAVAPDAHMLGTWTLKKNGETLFAAPRVAVVRSFMMNHIIHHRAQLGVYLRLNDVSIPGMYGPSADEAFG